MVRRRRRTQLSPQANPSSLSLRNQVWHYLTLTHCVILAFTRNFFEGSFDIISSILHGTNLATTGNEHLAFFSFVLWLFPKKLVTNALLGSQWIGCCLGVKTVISSISQWYDELFFLFFPRFAFLFNHWFPHTEPKPLIPPSRRQFGPFGASFIGSTLTCFGSNGI